MPIFKEYIYFLILFCLCLIDMINGFLVTNGYIATGGLSSPSQLGRFVVTIVLIYFCWKTNRSLGWFYLTYFLLLCELFNGLIFDLNFSQLALGVVNTYKVCYLALCFYVLSHKISSMDRLLNFTVLFKWHLYLIGFSLVFALITGLGTQTYTGGGLGTKGFFSSGNGIGLYMGLSTLLLAYLNDFFNKKLIGNLGLFFLVFSGVLIGTKTSIILSVISMAFIFRSNVLLKYVLLPLLFIVFISCFSYIADAFSQLFSVIVFRFHRSPNFIYFLGSGRIDYVVNAFDILMSQDNAWIRLPFGSGSFVSFQIPSSGVEFDTLETDFFDVLFMYGVWGALIYISVFIYMFKYSFFDKKLFVVVLLLFLHSFFAGHVVFNGMTGILIPLLLVLAKFLHSNRGFVFEGGRQL